MLIGLNQIVEHETTAEAWAYAVSLIRRYGRLQDSAYGPTKEIENLILIVKEPDLDPIPKIDVPIKPNWAFPAQMETYLADCWMTGSNPKGHPYTYGQFIWPRMEGVINLLMVDPDTRRAVIPLWREMAEPPCLNRLGFRIRKDRLNVTADFRSLDCWGAWPGDMLGISAIQDYVAAQLDIDTGEIATRADAGHVYLKDVA